MSTSKEIFVIESSICSATTIHATPAYTTITVASTYTSSFPCASPEELTTIATAVCTGNPDVPTTDQIAVNKTSINARVKHSTETVTKTVVLTSTISPIPCKEACISTLLVTALPISMEDVYIGYVEPVE